MENVFVRTPALPSEVKVAQSCLCDSLRPQGLYSPWNSPGQNTGVDSLFLVQGIFPTQGWNPGLPHCGRILYQLSYQGSPPSESRSVLSDSLTPWTVVHEILQARILEWVVISFSRGSYQPRDQTYVSLIGESPKLVSPFLLDSLPVLKTVCICCIYLYVSLMAPS